MGHVALIKWNLLHSATEINVRSYTFHKMDPILRSLERMPKMQFSMDRKFTLQLLC
jgi:hypothetical protein